MRYLFRLKFEHSNRNSCRKVFEKFLPAINGSLMWQSFEGIIDYLVYVKIAYDHSENNVSDLQRAAFCLYLLISVISGDVLSPLLITMR